MQSERRFYLDWNATAPMQGQILNWYVDALRQFDANPHSQHEFGRRTSVAVEKARESISTLVHAKAKQCRFTSGATEANAWVLSHFAGQEGILLGSSIEHPSVADWLDETIPVQSNGQVQLEAIEERLRQGGVSLVSVMAANNETGVLQPVTEIHQLCQRFGVPYHCDAAQVLNRIKWDASADFITLSGHKMGAPIGVGALILNREITPLLRGGGQERGSRAGTVNAPAIVTWGKIAENIQELTNGLQQTFEQVLCSKTSARIVGADSPRLPNTTLALFDIPGDMIVMALDMKGIAVSTGSACSSGSSKDSNVLKAMGYAGKPVRFSWGGSVDIRDCMHIIVETIQELEQACAW